MEENNFSINVEGEVNNLLFRQVQDHPLGYHLMQFMETRAETQKLAWNFVHVYLTVFHSPEGPFIEPLSFEVIRHLLECIRPSLETTLGIEFWILFYHSVVGVFGHLSEGDSYKHVRGPLIAFYKEAVTPDLLGYVEHPILSLEPRQGLGRLSYPLQED